MVCKARFFIAIISLWFFLFSAGASPKERYDSLQRHLAQGWNTWDTRSVLTHVLMPQGMAIELGVKASDGSSPSRYLFGDRRGDAPTLRPGRHTYDGTYTELQLDWKDASIKIETSANGQQLLILVTPLKKSHARLSVYPHTIWGRGNRVETDSTAFSISTWNKSLTIKADFGKSATEQAGNRYLISLDRPVIINLTKNKEMTPEQGRIYMDSVWQNFDRQAHNLYGEQYDSYHAMQSILGWNTIYDPTERQVITPVSRIWNSERYASTDFGGFCLYCWDTYFASMMLGTDNRDLAYANAASMTLAATESGFVPNCYYTFGFRSRDRSQPPVGSLAIWTLYEKYHDRWFIELLYPYLKKWNEWWTRERTDADGLICLGSSPYEPVTYFRSEYDSNTRYGAILESGLDNSAMYDNVPYDSDRHMLMQEDVGMHSLFIMDSRYLALIARELGQIEDAETLERQAQDYSRKLEMLWDGNTGFYYNRLTDNGRRFNRHTSPTCFYPMLAAATTPEYASIMVKSHLLNENEFWGEYVIPSLSRQDPAFHDNEYWRGRIWAPLNLLVYLGLRNYDFEGTKELFATKSEQLLLKSWKTRGYIFENYNAVTGDGDDVERSDKFYHWGALLGYISLIEHGHVRVPTLPILDVVDGVKD